jgi:hypothetical protein
MAEVNEAARFQVTHPECHVDVVCQQLRIGGYFRRIRDAMSWFMQRRDAVLQGAQALDELRAGKAGAVGQVADSSSTPDATRYLMAGSAAREGDH